MAKKAEAKARKKERRARRRELAFGSFYESASFNAKRAALEHAENGKIHNAAQSAEEALGLYRNALEDLIWDVRAGDWGTAEKSAAILGLTRNNAIGAYRIARGAAVDRGAQ